MALDDVLELLGNSGRHDAGISMDGNGLYDLSPGPLSLFFILEVKNINNLEFTEVLKDIFGCRRPSY